MKNSEMKRVKWGMDMPCNEWWQIEGTTIVPASAISSIVAKAQKSGIQVQ